MVYQNLDSGRAAYMYFVFVLFTVRQSCLAPADARRSSGNRSRKPVRPRDGGTRLTVAVAALSPNATIASLIFSTMLSLTLIVR